MKNDQKIKFKNIARRALLYLLILSVIDPLRTSTSIKPTSLTSFQNNDFESVEDAIKMFNINIKYRTAYGIDESWEKFKNIEIERRKEIINHSYGQDLLDSNSIYGINLEKLLAVVISNNENYLKIKFPRNKNFAEYNEENLKNILKILLEYISKEVKNNKEVTIEEMACKLSQLKIFNGFENPIYKKTLAEVLDNYSLIIYEDSMKNEKVSRLIREKVLCHEMEHLIQFACPDRKFDDVKRENGSSLIINDENIVDSFWYRFLYETAAESMVSYNKDLEPIAYLNQIPFFNLLKIATLPTKVNEIATLEKSQYDRSFETLYKVFNANNDDEKKELHFMLLGIETYLENRFDVIGNVRREYNSNLTNEEINDQLLLDSLKLANKFFYKNLIETNFDYPLSIESNFALMYMYNEELQKINDTVFLNNPEMKKQLNENSETLKALYISYLSYVFNTDKITLMDSFVSFNLNDNIDGCLSFLPKEEKDFLINCYSSKEEYTHQM